jgi:hypothetical protein
MKEEQTFMQHNGSISSEKLDASYSCRHFLKHFLKENKISFSNTLLIAKP